jgi:D-galactarolactone isomerase
MSHETETQSLPAPRLRTPPGACDTHMHFYDARYPDAPTSAFTPPDASVADYRKLQTRLGLDRVVIVQPSTYGRDNACQLEKREAFGDAARMVLVVDEATTDVELEEWTTLGARGARFYMLAGAPLPWDLLEPVAARVHEFGWHVQLQTNGHELADLEPRLTALPGGLVIDHIGRFHDPVGVDHPSFKALLGLVERGNCWVKLSGPYTSSLDDPPFDDVRATARALVKAAPERMLWASNWPHPGHRGDYDDAMLLDLLLDWTDDEDTCQRILADNPAELYGF